MPRPHKARAAGQTPNAAVLFQQAGDGFVKAWRGCDLIVHSGVDRGCEGASALLTTMIQAYRQASGRGCLQRTRLAQRPDVVEHIRTGGRRGGHDLGLAGVNRNWNIGKTADRLDYRDGALDFFINRYPGRAGTGRLSADVEYVRTLLYQRMGMLDSLAGLDKFTAIGKRIGRNIEYAHDIDSREIYPVI